MSPSAILVRPHSNRCMTCKFLFVVVVASARCRGYLQAFSIKLGHLGFKNHLFCIAPDPLFLVKIQTLPFMSRDIFIAEISSVSSVNGDRMSCPVRVRKWYLHRTKDVCPIAPLSFLDACDPWRPGIHYSLADQGHKAACPGTI